MKSHLILFILASMYTRSFAVDNLRLADMRCIGMGGNGVTQSILFNPSLLALKEDKVLYTDYFNRFGIKELGTVGAGFYYPNPILSTGVNISSFGYDKYRESMFRLAFGKRVGRKWQIGISIQYSILQAELADQQPQRLAIDIGTVYSPVDNLLIGMLILNFPSIEIANEDIDIKDFTSYSVQIGFQWMIINSLLIAATLETNKEYTLSGSIGIEYQPFTDFHIRAGMQLAPLLPTMGIGYRFSRVTTDVTAIWHPVLGISTGIGMSYTF